LTSASKEHSPLTTWLSQTKKEDSWTAVTIDQNPWRNLNVEQKRTVVENANNVDLVGDSESVRVEVESQKNISRL